MDGHPVRVYAVVDGQGDGQGTEGGAFMNTYDTFCETAGCRVTYVQQAESFDDAVKNLRALGWSAVQRDPRGVEYGVNSHCPFHAVPTFYPRRGEHWDVFTADTADGLYLERE